MSSRHHLSHRLSCKIFRLFLTLFQSYHKPPQCAEGLICHQRNGYDPVPGCDGGLNESSTADFCVWDGIGDPPGPEPTPPNGTFRLKLYWEEGYTWQNETFEREWCMMYNFDGYPGIGFDRCWRARDAIKCDPNQVFIAKCVTGEPRQWFTFIDLGNSSGVDEILIQTGDGERCFERYERDIWLEECDEENSLQRWYALNESFDGPRFEISQLGFETQLITNDHHPKSGEIVEMHHAEASRANDSQSSFWNKY